MYLRIKKKKKNDLKTHNIENAQQRNTKEGK